MTCCSLGDGAGAGSRRMRGGQPDFLAEPGDLVVLGGEPGQGLVAEAGELGDRGV